jgi:IS5 family transposase
VHIGNPSDTELLRPAIERIRAQFGVVPALVTADRGYWDSTIETDLATAGVTTVVIPRTGKPSTARARIEHADDFVDAVKPDFRSCGLVRACWGGEGPGQGSRVWVSGGMS